MSQTKPTNSVAVRTSLNAVRDGRTQFCPVYACRICCGLPFGSAGLNLRGKICTNCCGFCLFGVDFILQTRSDTCDRTLKKTKQNSPYSPFYLPLFQCCSCRRSPFLLSIAALPRTSGNSEWHMTVHPIKGFCDLVTA